MGDVAEIVIGVGFGDAERITRLDGFGLEHAKCVISKVGGFSNRNVAYFAFYDSRSLEATKMPLGIIDVVIVNA